MLRLNLTYSRVVSSISRSAFHTRVFRHGDAKPWTNGPGLSDFIKASTTTETETIPLPSSAHYLEQHATQREPKNVFVETYGCQMNVNDTEIIQGIMQNAGYNPVNAIDTVI